MSTEIRYNSKSLRLLYYRYKDSPYFSLCVFGGIIVISIILILQAVIPQLNNWFSIQVETAATQERISTIRDNTRYVTTYNAITLQEQVQTASVALPPEKEFIGILSAITASALAEQVALEDYDFSVGELSKTVPADSSFPTQVELTLSNDFTAAARFIEQIEKKIPLANVESVTVSDGSAIIKINFAYKPFPEIVANDTEPFRVISSEQQQLLNTLNGWKPSDTFESISLQPVASDSGQQDL